MRAKTSKLANLEKQRKSILTEDLTKCYFCHRPKDHIHEIYGGKNRVVSMKNGFCVPVCIMHHILLHNNEVAAKLLKEECQQVFEKTHSHKEFMQLIGKNYDTNIKIKL